MAKRLERALLGLAALAVSNIPAAALSVADCNSQDYIPRADNIAEPWEKNTKSFAGGNIRVAVLDTGEPACCSWHLVVLSPKDPIEPGEFRACHIVSDKPGTGFVGIDFSKLATSYDPKKGLLLSFPYRLYDNNFGGPGKSAIGKVRVNQASGRVTVEK